jgi:hypothetical protein
VTEHVGQIAHPHCVAELLGAREPGLEVAECRLAVDEELVHQRLPRPDREAPRLHESPDALRRVGPDLEVVVNRRQLAVEGEAQALVLLELRQDLVDDVDE